MVENPKMFEIKEKEGETMQSLSRMPPSREKTLLAKLKSFGLEFKPEDLSSVGYSKLERKLQAQYGDPEKEVRAKDLLLEFKKFLQSSIGKENDNAVESKIKKTLAMLRKK